MATINLSYCNISLPRLKKKKKKKKKKSGNNPILMKFSVFIYK